MTEAKVHDKNFLSQIQVPPFSMLVFDKAYNYYLQFAGWTEQNIYFVTRQKTNAVCEVTEIVRREEVKRNITGVKQEQVIEISYKEKKEEKKLK